MSENKEIEELKEQIKNLKDIVTRLEQGETKYERPDLTLKRKKADLYEKYFGKKEDKPSDGWHDYWVQRECYTSACTKIANHIFKLIHNKKTSDQITKLVATNEDIEEYCKLYESLFVFIIKKEEKTT